VQILSHFITHKQTPTDNGTIHLTKWDDICMVGGANMIHNYATLNVTSFCVCFCVFLVVSISTIDGLERLVPNMTCYVLNETLNSTYKLTIMRWNYHRGVSLVVSVRVIGH